MRSVGRLSGINFKLALAAAGLALAAAPVLAGQRPSEGAPSHGTAGRSAERWRRRWRRRELRPAARRARPATTAAASSGTSTASSSSGAASAPTFSGAARHAGYARRADNTGRAAAVAAGPKADRREHRSGGGEHAVPRGSGSSGDSGHNGGTTRSGGNSTTHTAAPANSTRTADPNADRAVPGWSRPRGDRPATGTAVERTRPPSNGGGVIIVGGGYYNPFFPYGFGYPGYSLGLGFGFSDPWYDPFMYSGYGYGYWIRIRVRRLRCRRRRRRLLSVQLRRAGSAARMMWAKAPSA